MTGQCPRCAKEATLHATDYGLRCTRCVQTIIADQADLERRRGTRRKRGTTPPP